MGYPTLLHEMCYDKSFKEKEFYNFLTRGNGKYLLKVKDTDGMTPFLLAARQCKPEIILLIFLNDDYNVVTDDKDNEGHDWIYYIQDRINKITNDYESKKQLEELLEFINDKKIEIEKKFTKYTIKGYDKNKYFHCKYFDFKID